jgi:uncharacterized damage-inducible protein DinB
MTTGAVLSDAFDRVREAVHGAVDGLDPDQLADRIDGTTNSIAWLVWHLARIQDDHVAGAFDRPQLWPDGWFDRFALPFHPADTGYGHGSAQVAAVRVDDADLLTGYYDAVHARTVSLVEPLADDDLARVVDSSWDPPVTLGVRLVSVIADDLQHAGQAALVRGILLGRH